MRKRDRSPDDFYRTPRGAALVIAGRVQDAWEPCAGDGALLDVLGDRIITASDINPRRDGIVKQDFLTCQRPLAVRMIVTNPPFSLNRQIIEKCLELDLPALLLIRKEWLDQKRQRDLQPYCKWQGTISELVKFETEDGRIVNGNGTCRVAWCLFDKNGEREPNEWFYYGGN